jgi:hypothetical protein
MAEGVIRLPLFSGEGFIDIKREKKWPRTQGGSRRLPGGGRSPAKPVSGGRFPANREKNRDSCLKMGFGFDFALNSVFRTLGCKKIP